MCGAKWPCRWSGALSVFPSRSRPCPCFRPFFDSLLFLPPSSFLPKATTTRAKQKQIPRHREVLLIEGKRASSAGTEGLGPFLGGHGRWPEGQAALLICGREAGKRAPRGNCKSQGGARRNIPPGSRCAPPWELEAGRPAGLGHGALSLLRSPSPTGGRDTPWLCPRNHSRPWAKAWQKAEG